MNGRQHRTERLKKRILGQPHSPRMPLCVEDDKDLFWPISSPFCAGISAKTNRQWPIQINEKLPKIRERYFTGPDFIAQLTLHIPPKGKRLVRRYGVNSSRSRATWKRRPALSLRAAEEWYGRNEAAPAQAEAGETVVITKQAGRKAWARLLAKVYGIDVLCCPECGGRMKVIAVIRDPESLRKIITCTREQGRGPP